MVKAVVGDEAWRSKGGRTGEGGEEGTSGLSISSTQPFNVEGRLYSQLECHSSADREKCLLFFSILSKQNGGDGSGGGGGIL